MAKIQATLPFSSKKHSGLIAAAQYAQQENLAVISNNLAMSDVSGAKSATVRFKEFVFKGPDGQKISFVRVDKVFYDFSQGGFKNTGMKTHVGLNGKGFFKVRGPKSDVYTRNGEFIISPEGTLTTATGEPVLSESNDVIKLTGDGVLNIDSKGNVSVGDDRVGKLAVVDFTSYENLRLQGKSFYTCPEPEIKFEGVVQQGGLERSNVSTMKEIVNLTFAHRHFEAAQKMLDEYDKNSKRIMNTSAKNV
jgi:flagellar basal-body rod protein FlgF